MPVSGPYFLFDIKGAAAAARGIGPTINCCAGTGKLSYLRTEHVDDETGWIIQQAGQQDVPWEQLPPCPICARTDAVDLSILPPRYRRHSVASLEPCPDLRVSVAHQRSLLAKLPDVLSEVSTGQLNTWFLLGPPRTGKTTMASAVLADALCLEWRDKRSVEPKQISRGRWDMHDEWVPPRYEFATPAVRRAVHRIEVPEFLAANEAWHSRDWGDETSLRPSNEAHQLQREITASTAAPPILVLDELEKFKPTPTRLNYLCLLVNACHAMGGTIIVTSNATETELRDLSGDNTWKSIWWRLREPNGKDGVRAWDLHTLVK